MRYRFFIRTGHAQGFQQTWSKEPPDELHVAPDMRDGWAVIPPETDPKWPGQKIYRRGVPLAQDGEVVVIPYDMEPDQRISTMPRPRQRVD